MGYYTGEDLPFYYGLHRDYTLCVGYFCSVLGPSFPNHLYLAAGTSGGVTTNDVGALGLLDYPCILDLLDAAGVSWKVYNGDQDPNVFQFFARFAQDRRARATVADYLDDANRGRLPGVSFIFPSSGLRLDEHPPADVSRGMTASHRSSAVISPLRPAASRLSRVCSKVSSSRPTLSGYAFSRSDAPANGPECPLFAHSAIHVSPSRHRGRRRPGSRRRRTHGRAPRGVSELRHPAVCQRFPGRRLRTPGLRVMRVAADICRLATSTSLGVAPFATARSR